MTAIDHRLKDNLQRLARRHLGTQGRAKHLRQGFSVARHCELANQDQKARTFIQDFPSAQSFYGIVEPKLREVRINAFAQSKVIVESIRLKTSAGFESLGVVFSLHPKLQSAKRSRASPHRPDHRPV